MSAHERKTLLGCGIAASLLYVAMNVFIPLGWPGYSHATRVVSELSAVDAPTRAIWVPLGFVYAALMTAFGAGVLESADRNRTLRVAGWLILVYGALGLVPWPPMHQREVLAAGGGSLTDKLHIVWTFVTVTLMMTAMGFGAAALGIRFRVYSIATIAALIAFGILTGRDSPAMAANAPTPLIGIWERIDIGVFLLWVVVFAVALMRRNRSAEEASTQRPRPTPVAQTVSYLPMQAR
jgi:hypothetical protein